MIISISNGHTFFACNYLFALLGAEIIAKSRVHTCDHFEMHRREYLKIDKYLFGISVIS